jgi:hypothetical protein
MRTGHASAAAESTGKTQPCHFANFALLRSVFWLDLRALDIGDGVAMHLRGQLVNGHRQNEV